MDYATNGVFLFLEMFATKCLGFSSDKGKISPATVHEVSAQSVLDGEDFWSCYFWSLTRKLAFLAGFMLCILSCDQCKTPFSSVCESFPT